MPTNNIITIAGVELTTDDEGRHNLNTLHRMSGEGPNKRPGSWLKTGPAQELIAEVEKGGALISAPPQKQAVTTVNGDNGGTFAVEQIAVAYANWISPKFYLTVIDAFLKTKANQLHQTPLNTAQASMSALLAIADMCGVPKHYALSQGVQLVANDSGVDLSGLLTHADCMTGVPHDEVLLEPTELGEMFMMTGAQMNVQLSHLGLQVKVGQQWTPTEKGLEYCEKHNWVTRFKSGYNLKWRAHAIDGLMAGESIGRHDE